MEEDEVGSLQPWQIFTTMFVGFWAISAYFDHFLMTGVFCIAFGVTAEVVTKFIYGEKMVKDLPRKKEELNSLLEKQQQENEKLTEEINILTISERNENIWKQAEEELKSQGDSKEEDEEEEDGPPPLPTKDYSFSNVVKTKDDLKDNCEEDGPPPLPTKDYSFNKHLIEEEFVKAVPSFESNCLPSLSKEEEIPTKEIDNFLEIEKYLSSEDNIVNSGEVYIFDSSEKDQISSSSSLDILSEETKKDIVDNDNSPHDKFPHPQVNHKFEKLVEEQIENECFGEQLLNSSSEYVRTQSDELNENTYMQDLNQRDEDNVEVSQENLEAISNNTPLEIKHPELSDMNCNQESNDDDSEYGLNEMDPNKVYAPDSSDDEDEFNEESESKEDAVNESESDSSEENAKEFTSTRELVEYIGEIKEQKDELPKEIIPEELLHNNEVKEQKVEFTKEIKTEKSSLNNITDTQTQQALNEELNDIDLTDPALEAAATKIQSVFKGFKSRRVVKN